MKEKKYALKYDLAFNARPEGYTVAELEDSGGCDAMILISLLREGVRAHDGALSFEYTSIDGQNVDGPMPLPDTEVFVVLGCLAQQLIDNGKLDRVRLTYCKNVVEGMRDILAMIKGLKIGSKE